MAAEQARALPAIRKELAAARQQLLQASAASNAAAELGPGQTLPGAYTQRPARMAPEEEGTQDTLAQGAVEAAAEMQVVELRAEVERLQRQRARSEAEALGERDEETAALAAQARPASPSRKPR